MDRKTEPKRKTFTILLLAALLGLASNLQAKVELQLDRTRITEGETVTLTFQTDDASQSLDADLSVLEKDFQLLDRRTQTQLTYRNGRQTTEVQLLITAEPRRSGDITIPALDFGGSRTSPVTLRVDPPPALEPGELPPVFLEVEFTPDKGPYYVHAQLGLVVRVFYQQNLTEAAISPPEPSQASVRLLQEKPYQAKRGGERYHVLERRYAIFPERSGDMTLPAMKLSGRLVERGNSSIWRPARSGRRVTVESDPVTLHIDPKPDSFGGDAWQPAREYNLSQQISGTDNLKVGEPVTRTVIIDAVGLEENMIAEPVWPALDNVRIYPDQPQGISRDDGDWVLGHKEFRYAVVPEKEGELVLPELTVHWWDTANDRERTATLPSQAIVVQASALVPRATPESTSPEASAPGPRAVSPGAGDAPSYWRWLALLFGALWLATLAIAISLGLNRARSRPAATGAAAADGGEANTLAALKTACRQGDQAGARRALCRWLRAFGPVPDGSLLTFAATLADPELSRGIRALDASGYRADDAGAWDGAGTWNAFEQWRKAWRAARAQQQPSPTDLYARANRRP